MDPKVFERVERAHAEFRAANLALRGYHDKIKSKYMFQENAPLQVIVLQGAGVQIYVPSGLCDGFYAGIGRVSLSNDNHCRVQDSTLHVWYGWNQLGQLSKVDTQFVLALCEAWARDHKIRFERYPPEPAVKPVPGERRVRVPFLGVVRWGA